MHIVNYCTAALPTVRFHKVFNDMTERNVVSWNVLVVAYRKHGCPHEALALFHQMQRSGLQPDHFTYASVLPACAKLGALEVGMDIHESVMESGFLSDVVVASALVDMYIKCGSIHKARELFDIMPHRNVVSWNAIIAGYAQNGALDEAVSLFKEMPLPDVISWNALITGFAQNGFLDEALRLFNEMPERNVVSWNAMIAGYTQNGVLDEALKVFKEMPQRDMVSWNTMIAGFVQNGALDEAIRLFKEMPRRDVVSWNVMIAGYAQHGILDEALMLFKEMPRRNVVSWNAMIAGYAQNGLLDEALRIFQEMPQRDVVSWNAMIAGYAQNELVEDALETFKNMQLAGVKPNNTTFASILPACAKMGALEQGMNIHQSIIETGFLSDIVVESALLDMYAKCGSTDKACILFKKMHQRDVVSWNAMIAGYAQNGFFENALETFKQMQLAGVKPNCTTFASILPACAKMGALELGTDIHQSIIESGFSSDCVLASALVQMYAKCGSIDRARQLFDKMPQRNVVAWTVMIAGYAQNGLVERALETFNEMQLAGVKPTSITFVCILFACSHAGLVNEGCKYFDGMNDSYCVIPTMDNYVCMVDLLGRAGYLDETLNFIIKMPIKPPAVVWATLLGACRSHKNIGLGVFTTTLLFELDPKYTAPYVLMSNTYAEVGRWDEVLKARRLMKDRGIKKLPGCSWIEVHKIVNVFCAGDRSHPQTWEIYAKLEKLSWEMKEAGYIPNSSNVLNDVEEEDTELFVCHHSEMLAIAFGLLNTSPKTTIRIVKNLRVCVNCHTATKFISKIVAREIIVRDGNRFHYFKQGQCSCGDYW
ncbi:pentatricopeptide repeat-containing protein At4g02750-like isoform X2 [Cryptomeria japonica]|uniref:pentatricopeptide repeat-containing protein At4g02750-like isoform X2 n=1 Tax=Cryptomeria japonica TaxID=3369 RepID=UPI0025ACAF11|nr:pentatricopeptide repeat-containing protein At4g02750-like isoform X2 [Cryptomeria japonica]